MLSSNVENEDVSRITVEVCTSNQRRMSSLKPDRMTYLHTDVDCDLEALAGLDNMVGTKDGSTPYSRSVG